MMLQLLDNLNLYFVLYNYLSILYLVVVLFYCNVYCMLSQGIAEEQPSLLMLFLPV